MHRPMHGASLAAAMLLVVTPASLSRGIAAPLSPPAGSAATGDPALLRLPDGRILFIGQPAGLYDVASRRWQPVDIPYRQGRVATLLPDGDVLLTGGTVEPPLISDHPETFERRFAEYVEASRRVERLEVRTGQRRTDGALQHAHPIHTATLLPDGRVLLIGGPVVATELYDPVRHLAMAAPPLAERNREEHTATWLRDGRLLVAGGADPPMGRLPGRWRVHDSAEIYDPRTGRFARTGKMSTQRYTHSATLLGDGRVLIAGGSQHASSAEIYDPATGTFRRTGDLRFFHLGHAAIKLPGGYVQLVGTGSCGPYDDRRPSCETRSSEIYDPRSGRWMLGVPTERCYEKAHALALGDGPLLVFSETGAAATPSTELLPAGTCEDPQPGLAAVRCSSGIPWEPRVPFRPLRSPALSPEPAVACHIRETVEAAPNESEHEIEVSLYATRASTNRLVGLSMVDVAGDWELALPPGVPELLQLSYSSPYLRLAGYVRAAEIPLRPLKQEVFGGFARPDQAAPYALRRASAGRVRLAFKLDDFVVAGESGWLAQELSCAAIGIRADARGRPAYYKASEPPANQRRGEIQFTGLEPIPLALVPGGPAVARLAVSGWMRPFYEKRDGWLRIHLRGKHAAYFGWVPAERTRKPRDILASRILAEPPVTFGEGPVRPGQPPLRLRCPHPVAVGAIDEEDRFVELGSALPGATLLISAQRRVSSECQGPRRVRPLAAMGSFVPVGVAEAPFEPTARFSSLFATKSALEGCTPLSE